ncbi:MAG: hypothetical protein J7L61_01675 [Thermoplasmata archaeon]|nr:hypothetical protein [Thermoplasmata archaeon]
MTRYVNSRLSPLRVRMITLLATVGGVAGAFYSLIYGLSRIWMAVGLAGMLLVNFWGWLHLRTTAETPLEVDVGWNLTIVFPGRTREVEWRAVEDILWKRTVGNNTVVGIFLNSGREIWMHRVKRKIAEAVVERWKEGKDGVRR